LFKLPTLVGLDPQLAILQQGNPQNSETAGDNPIDNGKEHDE